MIQRIAGLPSAAASFASTQARIAAVPWTPSQPSNDPSTPSVWSKPPAPQSNVTKNVSPQVNAYVRSFPGKFEKAQWTAVGVFSGFGTPSSWLPIADWTNDPAPNAIHLLYTAVTFGSVLL